MRGWILAASGLVSLAQYGAAQTADDQAARLALIQTPISSFAPIATSAIESEVQRHVMVAVRYGYLAGQSIEKQNFGATAIIPIAMGATVSFTGGVSSCIGCGTGAMLGVAADWRFWQIPIVWAGNGRRLTVSVNGEGGYGQIRGPVFSGGTAWTAAAGLPITLITRSPDKNAWRFVPFVTPGLGYGSLEEGDGPLRIDGWAGLLSGGVSLYSPSGFVAVNLGAQYIAVRDGDILIGAGLVLGRR